MVWGERREELPRHSARQALMDDERGDDDMGDRFRGRVPAALLVPAALACALVVAAAGIQLVGHSRVQGVSVLESRVPPPARGASSHAWQSLATSKAGGGGGGEQDGENEDEDEDSVIRFENDDRVGGGDLMVPVGMIDYENLGQGSIVDQRYPRKLPGQDELEAEIMSLFGFGKDAKASAVPKDTTGGREPDGPASGDAGKGVEDDSDAGEEPGKLERSGVNVNNQHEDPPVAPPSQAQKEDGGIITVDGDKAPGRPEWPYLKRNDKLRKLGVNVDRHPLFDEEKKSATGRGRNSRGGQGGGGAGGAGNSAADSESGGDGSADGAANSGSDGGGNTNLGATGGGGATNAGSAGGGGGGRGGANLQSSGGGRGAPPSSGVTGGDKMSEDRRKIGVSDPEKNLNKCGNMKKSDCRKSDKNCNYDSTCGCVPEGCACSDQKCITMASLG